MSSLYFMYNVIFMSTAIFQTMDFGKTVLSVEAVKISPCRVRNMVLQPHFGVSVKTKKMVDIVQIPPLLTQTIQVGYCVDNDRSYTDYSLPNMPNYICRQRYSVVEVYSKLLDGNANRRTNVSDTNMSNIKNLRSSTSGGEQDYNSFTKDFIVVEAGCEFSFNFIPMFRKENKPLEQQHTAGDTEHTYNPETVGMTSVYNGKNNVNAKRDADASPLIRRITNIASINPRANFQDNQTNKELSPSFENVENETTAKYESSTTLNSTLASYSANITYKNPEPNLNNGIAELGEMEKNSTGTTENADFKNFDSPSPGMSLVAIPNNETETGIPGADVNESELSVEDEAIKDGEVNLTPDDIGLPILILEPSMDPILKVISMHESTLEQ